MFFLPTSLKWCLTTFFCFFLFGCGSNSDPIIPVEIKDTKAPVIHSVYPDEDNSINFEVDFKVEIIFSELMNSDSLIAEKGIRLFSGNSDQIEEIELEDRESSITLSLFPVEDIDPVSKKKIQIPATKASLTHKSGRLALNNSYTVIINQPARDLVEDDLNTSLDERNYLIGSTEVTLTTEKGEWKSNKAVPNVNITNNGSTDLPSTNLKNRLSPKIVSNKEGDTFLLWLQEVSPGINQLWASRYSINSASWTMIDIASQICLDALCSNSTQISTINNTSVLEYDAAVNEHGQLAVVWTQAGSDGAVTSTWARLFDGSNLLAIMDISATGFNRTGNAETPQVGIDQNGNVVSVWREFEIDSFDNIFSRIKTNIFKVETDGVMTTGAWIEAPSYLDSADSYSHTPKFVMSSQGLAIAIWAQKESGVFKIFSSHLRLNQSEDFDWVASQRIDINNLTGNGDASLPSIAIDRNNDAMAVWLKHDGQRNNVIYSRFVGSWENPALVERDRLGDADYPTITISDSNRALVTWTQDNQANNSRKLLTRMFDITILNGWANEEEIASGNSIVKPTASFDREGNAVLLWLDSPNKANLNTSYFSKLTSSWSDAETIGASANSITLTPLLEDGRFLSIFEQEDTSDFVLKSVLFRD